MRKSFVPSSLYRTSTIFSTSQSCSSSTALFFDDFAAFLDGFDTFAFFGDAFDFFVTLDFVDFGVAIFCLARYLFRTSGHDSESASSQVLDDAV